jgi:hypothetical protein
MRDDVLLKLNWAYKRIEQLNGVIDEFVDSDPYGVTVEFNANTRQIKYRATKNAVIPDDVPLLVGDIVHNLRASLDYLVTALVRRNGGKITTSTGFPIANSRAEYKPAFYKRKIRGMRKEAKQIIHDLKPYKGGNDSLWRLHRLDIIDKHRFMFTVGVYGSVFAGPPNARNSLLMLLIDQKFVPVEAGTEITVDVPNAKFDDEAQCRVGIALYEKGVCEGEAVQALMMGFWLRVVRVLERFETLR